MTTPPPLDLDPVDVFARLVREVDAGRTLVELQPRDQLRDAALDALALARDVLDDARALVADPEPAPAGRCPHDLDPCGDCDGGHLVDGDDLVLLDGTVLPLTRWWRERDQ